MGSSIRVSAVLTIVKDMYITDPQRFVTHEIVVIGFLKHGSVKNIYIYITYLCIGLTNSSIVSCFLPEEIVMPLHLNC